MQCLNLKNKKGEWFVLLLFLACVFLPLLIYAQNADELNEKIEEQRKKIEQIDGEIESQRKKVQEISSERQTLQQTVSSLETSEERLGSDIVSTQDNIDYSNLIKLHLMLFC